MSKSKSSRLFAYEAFMEQARKEGRVRNEILSMKVLKPDLSLQARVNHIDKDHVRALHEILKNGQQLSPIIVFELPDGEFKIADGFHRHEVYKREDLPGIPSTIIRGSLHEAVAYASSCNQKLSLGRKREDIKKAAFMLFAIGWLDCSDAGVAKQIGVSPSAVARYRHEYCTENKIRSPSTLFDRRGKKREVPKKKAPVFIESTKNDALTGESTAIFKAKIDGKTVYLGNNKNDAIERFDQLVKKHDSSFFFGLMESQSFAAALSKHRIFLAPVTSSGDMALARVPCYTIKGCAVSSLSKWNAREILIASASAMFSARHLGLNRMIVVSAEIRDTFNGICAIAKGFGVEFMTFSQFLEVVESSEPGAAESIQDDKN